MDEETTRWRACLFDMDGVVVDTLEYVREAFRHTASHFGFEASDELLGPIYGRPLRTGYEVLYPGGDAELCMQCHREFQNARSGLVRTFPAMHRTLEALRSAGIRTAVVTSRTGPSAYRTLEGQDLSRLFDAVVTPEDTRAHKPDPEPLLLAARRLGVPPECCLMVGDTENDILAGKAAGMGTVGATYGFIGKEVLRAEPTYAIASPEGLLAVLGLEESQASHRQPPEERAEEGVGRS